MVRSIASVVVAAALTATPTGDSMMFRLTDPRLHEASGIAVGMRSPGVFYVQNDSGDSARFFAISRRTGRVVSRVRVAGARNVDWEDIAVARDAAGTPSVWLADIGDNAHNRRQVQIYRVSEPRIGGGSEHDITVRARQVWHLRYPSGRPDAESLAVTPGGRAFIATKSIFGASAVYEVPVRASSRVQVLKQVGMVHFRPSSAGSDAAGGPLAGVLATGAALSPDGRTLVIRTYTDAWFWPVSGSRVGAALSRRPVRVPLPPQPQGEGITFTNGHVVIDSEHVGSQVWSVPVPPLARSGPAAASTLASSSSVAASASPGAAPRSRVPSAPVLFTGLGVAAVVVLAATGWGLRSRRAGR